MIDEKSVHRLMTSVQLGSKANIEAVNAYIDQQLPRFVRTLQATPQSGPHGKLLDIGGLANLAPCYSELRGYYDIYIASADSDSPFAAREIESVMNKLAKVQVSYFDAEKEKFPFSDQTFDTVLFCEVLEHLTFDPMALMAEINRVTKDGGILVLTTPNIISWSCLLRMVSGKHPSSFSDYSGINSDRHNREYTPREVGQLARDAGFEIVELQTFDLRRAMEDKNRQPPLRSVLKSGKACLYWCIKPLSRFFELPPDDLRGEFVLLVAKKTSPVRDRMPNWLYGNFKEDRELMAAIGRYRGPI